MRAASDRWHDGSLAAPVAARSVRQQPTAPCRPRMPPARRRPRPAPPRRITPATPPGSACPAAPTACGTAAADRRSQSRTAIGPVARQRPAANPPIDCFYVYPTVSRDPGLNSDLDMGATEEQRRRRRSSSRASLGVCRTVRAGLPLRRRLAASPPTSRRPRLGADLRPRLWRRARRLAPLSRALAITGRPVRPDRPQPGLDPSPQAARSDEIEGRPGRGATWSRRCCIGCNVEVPRGAAMSAATFRSTPLCTPRRPDRLRRHLYVLPRRSAAARRLAVRPRRAARA